MQLVYVFLAESAGYLQDSRLCVFGADFNGVEANKFPISLRFYFVAKLRLMPDEPQEGHTFTIAMRSPTGDAHNLSDPTPLRVTRNTSFPDRPSGANIIVGMATQIPGPGEYTFLLVVDGQEVEGVPLYVSKSDRDTDGSQQLLSERQPEHTESVPE